MRSSTMRRFLPLALACLLAAQAVSAGRYLQQKKAKATVPTWRKQYVQFTISIQGTTCAQLPQQGNLDFNQAYRRAIRQDVTSYITAFAPIGGYDPAPIVATIGTPGTDCTDWTYQGVNYAGLRAAASFNGTNTTLIRDFLWDSTRDGICKGGYRTDVWQAVAGLMAANNLSVRLNNGSRLNPFGVNMGWVPIPQLPCPAPRASPSPPATASPSPAPASCASIPNSVQQPDGTCQCTNPSFAIEGKNGATLVYCVSTAATVCPAPVSTAVKDNNSPVPRLLGCITPDTECPAPYTFPLYGGSPSTKQECRLPVVDCTYTPYTFKITDANGVLVGCVNPAADACPFVAFREASNDYKLDFCRKVDSCPIYSTTPVDSTRYTTSGRAADRTLTACLTLAGNNKCPADVPNANYPIEVVLGDPTSCGGAGQTCTYGTGPNLFSNTRVEECLARGAACDPARFPLQIFNFEGAGAVVPTLVGCRQARPFPGICDFTAAAMGTTAKDPNAAGYNIEVYQTQANLVGCVVANSTRCPAAYPVAQRNAAGVLQSCGPSNNADNPCIANSAEPVPLRSANGTWLGICVARTQSCLTSYASEFNTPVTIRNAIGDMIECREQIGACPNTPVLDTDGTSTVLSTFPLYKAGSSGRPVITSCYPPAAVGNTCQLTIDGAQYFTPIRSSTAGAPLQGCLAAGSTQCPADFPFTVLNGTTVVSCAPAGDQTSCASPYIPATTSGVLVGCLLTTVCPSSAFPTTIATGINQPAIECMTAGSVCYKSTQPFSLYEQLTADGSTYLELTWCINPQQSITNCDQANPATVGGATGIAWQNAAEVYNNAGTSIIGCIRRPDPNSATSLTTCPVEASFIFKDVNGATFQCRAGIAPQTSCAAAVAGATAPPTIGEYKVDVKNLAGELIGCTVTGGNVCPPGGIIVSETANSVSELCLAGNVTSCAGISTNGAPRTFPIYSGTNADGSARLVRCIAPVVGTDCSSTAVNGDADYNVPVYSNADGTGQVIGCVRKSSEEATPCPSTAPFYLLGADAAGPLRACLQDRLACNITTTAWSGYRVPLTTSNATDVLGCTLASSTACPSQAAGSPYTVPFIIRNPDGTVFQCQLAPLNPVTSCAGFQPPGSEPIVNSTIPGATGPVVGCQIPGNTSTGAGVFPNACADGFIAFYDSAQQLVSCQPPGTLCGGRYELSYFDAVDGVTLDACQDFDGLARRRSLLQNVRAAAGNEGVSNGCAAGYLAFWNGNSLVQCRKLNGANVTECVTGSGGLVLSGAVATFTTELYYKVTNISTLEGCLSASSTSCPAFFASQYNFFVATITGTLESCSEAGDCPAPTTIPVYSSSNAGLVNPIRIGCVTPSSTNTTSPCPTWNGTAYTFFTADAGGVVTGCYLNAGVNNTCPDSAVRLQGIDGITAGCIPAATVCPAFAINNVTYEYEFWGATSISDATAKLARCVAATNITGNCATYTGFEVPLQNGNLSTNLASLASIGVAGCVASGAATGAQCPVSHPKPLLNVNANGTLEIIACFKDVSDSSCLVDYPGYNVPLCDSSIQQATLNPASQCAASNTLGCIRDVAITADNDGSTAPLNGNSTFINTVLSRCYAASARKYPTTQSFQRWVAGISESTGSNQGDLDFLFGCFITSPTPTTICDPSCTDPGSDGCYGTPVTFNNVLLGCVDGTQPACDQFIQQSNPTWSCDAPGSN